MGHTVTIFSTHVKVTHRYIFPLLLLLYCSCSRSIHIPFFFLFFVHYLYILLTATGHKILHSFCNSTILHYINTILSLFFTHLKRWLFQHLSFTWILLLNYTVTA